jgi:uncharacterized protein YhbP (UPF0306 family)
MWNPLKSFEGKAKSIIERNKYMTVATSSKDAKPWAAAVFYVYDDEFNFYFVSAVDSLHAMNIKENPKICLEIYDSRQPIGSADQVQIIGTVEMLQKEQANKAIEIYHQRLFRISGIPAAKDYNAGDYDEPAEFRIFKVTVNKAYTTGPDRRVEVNLKS